MFSFIPTISVGDITDITEEMIKKYRIKAFLLDIDNTLSAHGSEIPNNGVEEWINNMKNNGLRIMIISNNKGERVKNFSNLLNLEYIDKAKKPLRSGFNKALNILNTNSHETMVIGDQIFTDILGANLSGIKSALVTPKDKNEPIGIKIKRVFEIPFKIVIKYKVKDRF